jgi:UDP-N-acetylmuramoylalanine--D-glutamate ligase
LRVLVAGAGVSGRSAAEALLAAGAEVTVTDGSADRLAALASLESQGAQLVPGLSTPPEGIDLVVTSPGWRPDAPLPAAAATAGIDVIGEVELAWWLDQERPEGPATWLAVTGTNGKTTTVSMLESILRAAGADVVACGNVGLPVVDAVRAGHRVLAVELSSFQLHWQRALRPKAGAVLNLADDHLDWHGSPEAYRDAKARVYANTKVACVYNRADEATRAMVEDAEVEEGARAIGFGLDTPGPSDFGVVDGILCDRAFLEERQTAALELTTLDELEPLGLAVPHVVANILAASAFARSYDVPVGVIHDALATFRLDAHRIETVAVAGGIRWIDDSKATNPHAAEASLRAFGRVVWIVGGLMKGVDADALVERHVPRLRAAVVIGRDRAALVEAFRRHAPGLPLFEVATDDTESVMPDAVALAASVAEDGDTVLLAPAAASMDQFADYADRGRRFHEAVRERLGGEAHDQPASDEPPAEGR